MCDKPTDVISSTYKHLNTCTVTSKSESWEPNFTQKSAIFGLKIGQTFALYTNVFLNHFNHFLSVANSATTF